MWGWTYKVEDQRRGGGGGEEERGEVRVAKVRVWLG
jgi:hypothetical protein